MIPCANPRAQYAARKTAIDEAIAGVLDRGSYVLGEETRAFEGEFAAYVGARFGIGVGNGTDALHIALRACGVGPGDEVITVSHTAVATVAAIELSGANAVLVDIRPDTYTLDPARLEGVINARTKAIIPVHLYGEPADLTEILDVAGRHGLRVIEDCAQAHGAAYSGRRVGSWGDLGCFSFYPTKNLGALGDGGMVVTSSPKLAEQVRLIREYGWSQRYISAVPGCNSRLDELQAAILRVKLRTLDGDNAARARLAARYSERLDGSCVTLPTCAADRTHVYHLYAIRSDRRDALRRFLTERGIGTLVHYPVPVHLQPAYRGRLRGADRVPEAELAAEQIVSLPMYPELDLGDVELVADAVAAFAGRH